MLRETFAGLINGVAFACIMGLIVFFWFGSNSLGAVIGAAMVINLLAAALAGIFVPLALERSGVRPGSVVHRVRDDGDGRGRFFAFLGLASLWLL